MNPITVIDIHSTLEVQTAGELESALAERDGSGNHFMLVGPASDYPMLDIMVRDRYAALHYFGEEGSAGAQAVSDLDDPPAEVEFPHSAMGDLLVLPGSVVVDVATASRCALEFAESLDRPASVEWREL